MRALVFAKRNFKEILRDPMAIVFGIGFPVIMLFLMSIINKNIPPEAQMTLFEINRLFPAVAVFGLSFISLFSGFLISKDRTTSLFIRLCASPMKSVDFIAGYALSLIPVAVIQLIIALAVSVILSLKLSAGVILCVLSCMISAVMFISTGLILGTVFTDKAVGGIASIIVNLTAWLSGAWFDLDLLGGTFKKICRALPFANAVDAGRYLIAGEYSSAVKPILIVTAYTIALAVCASVVFSIKNGRDK